MVNQEPRPTHVAQYQLLERIAVGGMAEVYRAARPQQVGGARAVVVKRMLPKIASDKTARAMFAEEAQLGARIRHPNVVQVIDYGEDNNEAYLVLEFVQGVDLWRLSRFLTREGKQLTVPQAVYIAREMLAGLHAVHEAVDEHGARLGVVHRDVSPSNVLLSIYGEVKLGDLGIARSRLREKFPSASVGERAKGKLGYLAPEQVRGVEFDRRADIFSAGVVIAELLMGRPLFAGGSELAVLLAIRDSKVHPFSEFSSQLPEGLGDLVTEALSQKVSRRPPNAELFSSRLSAYQSEPAEELRSQIATMVAQAFDRGPKALPLSLTPTRTLTDPHALIMASIHAEARDSLTPHHHLEVLPDDSVTPAPHGPSYQVRTTAGTFLGPWSLAETVQAVSTGNVGPLDQVQIDGSALRPVGDVPELARHLPSSTITTNLEGTTSGVTLSGEVLPLDDGGIVLALARAAVERMTALMLCELGGVRKEVYIKDGSPAFVTSNLAGELLGEYLVNHGVISRGELDMALAVMPRFEGRLGDTLSALGLVEPVMLFRHIGQQVRDKLLDLFLWRAGSCTHYHGVAPPPSGFPLNIDAWDVLDEGLRRRVEAGLEEQRLNVLRVQRLLPASGSQLTAMRSALPQRHKRLLSELDRPTYLGVLAQRISPEDPSQTERDALLLHYLDALRIAD